MLWLAREVTRKRDPETNWYLWRALQHYLTFTLQPKSSFYIQLAVFVLYSMPIVFYAPHSQQQRSSDIAMMYITASIFISSALVLFRRTKCWKKQKGSPTWN